MQSLANKYRPQKISDLIGQQGLVQALTNSINDNTIPQSIVLIGIRGTGKTTTGRAIARSLLCESGPTINPCMTCPQCVAITNNNHPDLIEIDAASHASVDAARAQIAGMGTRPMMGKWRIRIIDEAHGLSSRAWDVWLKTIEEPPPNEIFIFATTEGRDIPATVRSRSNVFMLPPIATDLITERLLYIAGMEGINLDPRAAHVIAKNGDGSLRDSISMLEQAYREQGQNPITVDAVQSMLGLPNTIAISQAIAAICRDNDVATSIKIIRHIFAEGAKPQGVLKSAQQAIYQARIASQAPELLDTMGLSPEEREASEYLARAPTARIQATWEALIRTIPTLKDSPLPEETLTMAIISTTQPK